MNKCIATSFGFYFTLPSQPSSVLKSRFSMTVLETRRSRRVANQKAEHLTLDSTFDDKEGYYNDTTDASIDDHIVEEKVSDGLNIPLLKQMGTYIPFEIGFDLLAALHITLVAAVIRLYRIDYPNSVV